MINEELNFNVDSNLKGIHHYDEDNRMETVTVS